MSLSVRIIFFGIIGLIAGILAWPFAELILYFQVSFPSLLFFSITLGITIGVLMGGCFGLGEGLVSNAPDKIMPGILMGMLIGTVGGLIGFVTGQAALLLLGTTIFNSPGAFQKMGFPLSKALGWGAFGLCIGSVEGIRCRSRAKIVIGLIGGVIGGILGGLVFEFIRVSSPENPYMRLIGLLILGLMIGLGYGLVENQLSRASLYLLNGKNKGREFLLTHKMTTIGKDGKVDVGLSGYRKVADQHAEIHRDKDDFVFSLMDQPDITQMETFVNDGKTEKKRLSDGDILRVGSAQLQFRKR